MSEPGRSKISYLLERLSQGVAAHDRENPGHHTWGVGMTHFDIERLGLEEGEAADDPGVQSDLYRADATDGEDQHSIFAHARDAAPVENAAGDSADPDAAAPASSSGPGDAARD